MAHMSAASDSTDFQRTRAPLYITRDVFSRVRAHLLIIFDCICHPQKTVYEEEHSGQQHQQPVEA